MTEKRFRYDNKTVSILKDGEFWLDGTIDTACNHSEICNELNEQHEENQQLKTTIIEAYNNERTEIGKSVLKQLIEQME